MERYRNLRGNSNVSAYEIADDNIVVEFNDGSRYLYNTARPGLSMLNELKRLADSGRGLNAYISTRVKERYAAKLR